MIDVASVRPRFPALQQRRDPPVLFFDNPAGTQVPRETIDAVVHYLTHDNANVDGAFSTSLATEALIDQARRAMVDFLGATSIEEIVFGLNMTSLTFQLSHALARILRPGDEIVTTRLEHDANVAPWLAMQQHGIVPRFVDIRTEDMTLDLQSAKEVITDRTRLVACGYASNAFGTVNDVARLAALAHSRGAWVFVDAVHYGPHGPIDVQALGADLLVTSPYKFFGPHMGVLYGRREVLERIPVYHVRPAGDEPPSSWETGTKSHEAIAGLLGTIAYLESLAPDAGDDRRSRLRAAMTRIRTYERTLSERLIGGLGGLRGVRVLGITDPARFDRRVPTVSFLLEGVNPFDGARALGGRGIFSWAGDHYAVEPLRCLGIEATQRIGLVHYNTAEEIDRFLNAVEEISTPVPSSTASSARPRRS